MGELAVGQGEEGRVGDLVDGRTAKVTEGGAGFLHVGLAKRESWSYPLIGEEG